MTARVDATPSSVVAWCTECSAWSELARDLEHGHRMAEEHDAQVHPDSRNAEINRFRMRRRHAQKLVS